MHYLLSQNLTKPYIFISLCFMFFLIIMSRYVILNGLFHIYFYVWQRKVWEQRKMNKIKYIPKQFRTELGWSVITALIFSVTGAIVAVFWQKGLTSVYLNINDLPLWWFPTSIITAMFIHETYYYWLHRLMHHPEIFKRVHKVHHDSKITSVWTAFSFHPVEGFLEAIAMPILIIFLPLHIYAIVFLLSVMTISAAINHLDIEIYPRNFLGNFIGNYFIGSTHHSHHHKLYRYNFGLYFTFWDKWSKTESPSFKTEFRNRSALK